jgi:hypothetical protein
MLLGRSCAPSRFGEGACRRPRMSGLENVSQNLMSWPRSRQIQWRGVAIIFILCLTGCARKTAPEAVAPTATTGLETRRVSFVQWTDPHIFDAGEGRHGEAVVEEELDNWAAFHWAVLKTNQLVLAEHHTIDFVVITGDFGLDNVELPKIEGVAAKPCDCPRRKPGEEGPIDKVPLAEAAHEVARELSALVVKRVYLVPGDNDLCHEDANDLHRWAEFVLALQDALAQQRQTREASLTASFKGSTSAVERPTEPEVIDLTDTFARLYARKDPRVLALISTGVRSQPSFAKPPEIHGIKLLGVDSAFFKVHDEARLQSVADAAIPGEIEYVGGLIHAGTSYLVFTHIPDLKDPYLASKGKDKPSWKLAEKVRTTWRQKILDRSEVLGVFAGHYHVATRDLYPHNFAYAKPDENTAAKLWLAPPLAEKSQWRSPSEETARGMLLVSVNADGDTQVSNADGEYVKPSAIWYTMPDQKAETLGDDKLAEARAAELDDQWADAANKYHDALGVTGADARTRSTALSGYLRAHEVMRLWWWQSPLGRWLYLNRGAVLYSIVIVLALVLGWALLRGIGALKMSSILLKILIIPSFRGRAVISDTVQLTADAPVKEFTARLQAEGEEIKRRLLREKETWAAGHITLLAPAASTLDSMVSSIPKVESLNVSDWVRFFVNLLQTCRWTVQTGLAIFPPDQTATPAPRAPGADKSDLPPGSEVNAYAVLQWGWVVKNSWRRKVLVGDDRSALRDLARELAELILGEAFV